MGGDHGTQNSMNCNVKFAPGVASVASTMLFPDQTIPSTKGEVIGQVNDFSSADLEQMPKLAPAKLKVVRGRFEAIETVAPENGVADP
jgi:hypothetical protein